MQVECLSFLLMQVYVPPRDRDLVDTVHTKGKTLELNQATANVESEDSS